MTGDWAESALCAQTDPEAFFPEKGHNATAAKRICRQCPVRAECLAYAVATGQQHGVWGGVVFGWKRTDTRRRLEQEAGEAA